MKRLEFLILIVILTLALGLRLYKINRPIADWHSWRQADTAAVARNFVKDGFTFFVPKYDDMSSQANGLDNPNRYRFVEFPIYNALIAAIWKITGVQTVYARLTTVILTLFSTAFLYFLVRKFSSQTTAAFSAFFFAIIPYNVFYSSTILPGNFMVFALLGTYLSFAKWLDNDKKLLWLLLSIVFANLAILSWPIALIFMLPVAYLALEKYKLKAIAKPHLWVFAAISVAPFVAWRLWMTKFPEGIPNYKFLLNEGNIRFKGAFFRWLIAERMGKLILTTTGFSLFVIGVVTNTQNKAKFFYFSILASVGIYFSIFASGNVRHDYYQIPAIFAFSIFMGIGASILLNPPKELINKYISRVILLALIIFMMALGFYEVQGYYWINKPQIVEAGQAVDRLLPKDATVVAPYNGDSALLYQTNRRGYPITDRPLETFIDQGTKYLVSVDVGDAGIKNLAVHCNVVEQTKDYVIVEMFKDCIGK